MSENLHHNSSAVENTESEDVALAKILQQQERAFLELRGAGESLQHQGPPPGMTEDEELAWRLMQEEEAIFQQRMMAMAGVGTIGSSGVGDDTCVEHVAQDEIHVGPFDDDRANQEGSVDVDPDTLTYEELTTLGELAGTVACGLTDEQMGRLVQSTHGELTKGSMGNEGDDDIERSADPCIVCQLDFEAEDPVIRLPCGHLFHDECLRPWLARKKTCPFCNIEIK